MISVRLTSVCLAFLWATDSVAIEGIESPWLMPFDVGRKYEFNTGPSQPTQEQMYEFAWESFIALNWPYLANSER